MPNKVIGLRPKISRLARSLYRKAPIYFLLVFVINGQSAEVDAIGTKVVPSKAATGLSSSFDGVALGTEIGQARKILEVGPFFGDKHQLTRIGKTKFTRLLDIVQIQVEKENDPSVHRATYQFWQDKLLLVEVEYSSVLAIKPFKILLNKMTARYGRRSYEYSINETSDAAPINTRSSIYAWEDDETVTELKDEARSVRATALKERHYYMVIYSKALLKEAREDQERVLKQESEKQELKEKSAVDGIRFGD